MPFSTGLLAEFITYRLALVVYWLNLLLLGAVLFASFGYAERPGLMKDDTTAEMLAAGRRRIVVYQALYAVCLLVGVVSTYAGIALLVLLQLNSAIAPPDPPARPVLSRPAGRAPWRSSNQVQDRTGSTPPERRQRVAASLPAWWTANASMSCSKPRNRARKPTQNRIR